MVNKTILLGRVGKQPEQRKTSNGKDVLTFSLATSEYYKDADGQKQENTTWHNIVAFNKAGIAPYIHKGSKLYIEGKISNRKYEKDGVTKYISEIIASNILLLDSKNEEYKAEPSDNGVTADSLDDDWKNLDMGSDFVPF